MNHHIFVKLNVVSWLRVNALSERIIGIYLHEFTNNEREISLPHSAKPRAVLKILSSLLENEYR